MEWPVVFNSITNYDDKPLHSNGAKGKGKKEEARRLLFVSITRARDLLYITGQYVAYGKKDDQTYNQFLREIYEALEVPYCPIDPNADLKAAARKNRAAARKKGAGFGGMTTDQTQNSFQLSLLDLGIA